MKTKKRITERRLESVLARMLERYAVARTFQEAGVLTNNKGIVVTFPHGEEFQITIVDSGCDRRW